MTEVQNATVTPEKRVTNMAKAREIYRKAEDKSRKTIIQAFMEQLGQTQATASTYYYTVAPKVERVSNVAKAREIYAAADDKSRKFLVPIFMAELGQSENVASTYYYNCKKHFAELAEANATADGRPVIGTRDTVSTPASV